MVVEFGIDSGWVDHPGVLERLWSIAVQRWDNRAKTIEAQKDDPENPQRQRMRAELDAKGF